MSPLRSDVTPSGRWSDLAVWRGPTVNHGGPMVEQRGLVLHIAEGTYEGTISWQKNPAAQVSSHFVVDTDGTIAQVVEVDVTAWTQILGNGHWLSVENAGHTPHPLTAAQVEANAQLLARCHREFGVPLQIATAPSGRGLGHHSMGAENGVNWGHSDCPGPAIIAQKPAIVARAIQIIEGDDMPLTPDDLTASAHAVWYTKNLPSTNPTETPATALLATQNNVAALVTSQAAQDKQLAALLTAVTALAKGGTSVDTAAVLAAITAEGEKESAAVTALLTRLAAAEKAHADALAAS